ncbi:hypothetical protein G7Y89_g2208 [Cudoniella acicularis]|uniref:Mitochondrial fission 1 protein n=1 Tax=Cudoniella acicularis TaxID=354080 RepID=A0A8H4RVH9_9HELO|nr:hypothetical protein G7Y89_g2208 [Cudoniella acicularis]
MGSTLPYAADAESPLKPAELQVLRAQFEKEGEHVGVQTKFNFAWGLIKSNTRQDQQEGVRLLSDIFRTSPERRRECLYYLALGNYKLGNYAEARRYNDLLLEKEPANMQASSLRGLIDDKVAKEGLMGVAILSGVAIAAGVVGVSILKIMRSAQCASQKSTFKTAFRFLRNTGVAVSLGLTALAAYQGIRDAMADNPTPSGGGRRRHLDAFGSREVVFCHACENEWFKDEHENGLVCPECQSEVTEIITPESDPRPIADEPPPPNRNFRDLHHHNPFGGMDDDSDPEEADIEEHITHGPGGSMFFSQTIRTSRPRSTSDLSSSRRRVPRHDADAVMANFHNSMGSLMSVAGFRPGQAGRSGPDTLFNERGFGRNFQTFGSTNGGPSVVGGRFTFTTGPLLRPRNADGPQPGGPPVDDIATYETPYPSHPGRSMLVVNISAPPDELPRIIGNLFGPMGEALDNDRPGPAHPAAGLPPGLQALFAAMLNPANARSGDAVYSQEALDQIISTLMEQHPTSNAPGPAPPDAIASLPKTKLDEKLLGPEGKGECSVCMDDVYIGTEVVLLPCSHWFHEACASAWLSEHNTCPICRKGIGAENEATPTSGRRESQSNAASEPRVRRLSAVRPSRLSRSNTNGRNEARLDAIRNTGRLTPTEEFEAPRRRPFRSIPNASRGDDDPTRSIPGSYPRRLRDEDREPQRASRRTNTSGSDHSRLSRRSSQQSSSSRAEGGGGPMQWLRDRLGSSRRSD